MTQYEISEKLNAYRWALKEAKRAEDEYKRGLLDSCSLRSPVLSDMPKGSPMNNDLSAVVARIDELYEQLARKKNVALEKRIELDEFLEQNLTGAELLVMRYRYENLLKWEDISRKIMYDRSHVYRLYKSAINHLKDATK